MSSPTIRTIAQHTGYGKSTVSLALRNHPSIPAPTRETIQAAAKEMGYRPNPYVASLLAHVRNGTFINDRPSIGIVHDKYKIPTQSLDPVAARISVGAIERARTAGFNLDFYSLREPGMTQSRMNKILRARNVEALFLLPLNADQGHSSLDLSRSAVATTGYSIVRPELPRVCHHDIAGITQALKRLRRRRCVRIGLAIPESHDLRTSHLWLSGFLSYQHLFQSKKPVEPLITGSWNQKTFFRWLNRQKPDAVVSAAAEVAEWLEAAGREDVQFAVLNWMPSHPHLSGIDQNYEEIGAAAVDLIAAQLSRNERGIPSRPQTLMINSTWREGIPRLDNLSK